MKGETPAYVDGRKGLNQNDESEYTGGYRKHLHGDNLHIGAVGPHPGKRIQGISYIIEPCLRGSESLTDAVRSKGKAMVMSGGETYKHASDTRNTSMKVWLFSRCQAFFG